MNLKIHFLVLTKHAPIKCIILRANHGPYMSKPLRKAIIGRPSLETKSRKAHIGGKGGTGIISCTVLKIKT